MKKKQNRPINLTDHDPVWDEEDCIDYSENFKFLLATLFSRKITPSLQQKIKFLVSAVTKNDTHPHRYEKEVVYSFGYLCRMHKKWFKKDFNLDEWKNRGDSNWEDKYEREFRQRSAWGGYVQTMHTIKLHEQENEIQSLPRNEQEAKRKEFEQKNGSPILYIG